MDCKLAVLMGVRAPVLFAMALEEVPCPHCNELDKVTVPGEVENTFEETDGGLLGSVIKTAKSATHTEADCSHCGRTYTVAYR